MAYNKKAHLRRNIDALKVAFALERDPHDLSSEEFSLLSAYSGFGAIKEVLETSDSNRKADGIADLVAELHEVIKSNTADEREYKRYIDGIKNSVLTAFYTPPEIAHVIVDTIWSRGIEPRRILDPSAGTGIFPKVVEMHEPFAEITCFEKDPATALILKHLHPRSRVRAQGYETIEPKYAGYYDMAVSNIPFGDVALFDPFFSTHTDPVRRQGTRTLHNYFFMKTVDTVREGGIVAFITSQGVLNAEQGRPIREWLMKRCDVVSAVRLPNNLFIDHAGTEVGSDLIILQKKASAAELSPRQLDFIESRKLTNGIRVNNLFRTFDRVIHTDAKVGTDPYGKPAMEFTHTGGIIAIANELRQMLSDDLRTNLDVDYYLSHAPADEVRQQTPLHSQQARTVAVESEETRRTVAEMAAQGYSLDTETGELTALDATPQQAAEYAPSGNDLAEFGAWAAEKERQLWEAAPPQPEDFGIAESAATETQATAEPARQSAAEPVGSLFDIPATSQPAQPVAPQEPLLTLYDLFGFSEQERSQTTPKRRNRRAPARTPAHQPSLFSQPAPSEPQPAEPVAEQAAQTQTHNPEELYASLNWEDNPPINGFYQMMMGLTPERRAELRQEPAERREQQPTEQAPRAASPRTQVDTEPRAFGGEMLSHYREGTLAMDENGRVGYLRDLDALRPMFHTR